MKTTTERGGMSRAADGSALPYWSAITGENLAGRDEEQVHPNLAVSARVFHSFICPLLGLYERNLGNHWLVAKRNKTVASLFNSHDDETPNSLPRAGARATSGRQHPRDAAGLFRKGRRVSPPGSLPVAAQLLNSSSPLTDSEISGEPLYKWWEEVTTSV